MSTMRNHYFLFVFLIFTIPASSLYCSSYCIDYTGVCSDETSTGCTLCTTTLFNIIPIAGSCTILPQTSVLVSQLSDSAMSLFGYSTTNALPLTCNNYTFSGQYISTDYLSKNYTNIPMNHYQLIIRYNIAFMGTWSSNNTLRLHIQDDEQSINYDYVFGCSVIENICDELYNTTDCVRIHEKVIAHNATFVALNFSALTSQTDPNVQSWGIRELIIAAKLCHGNCQTCFGPTDSDCLSCVAGMYLQGNVCLPSCNAGYFTVTDQRLCTQSCPSGYFANVGTCTRCTDGCLVCSSIQLCQAWVNETGEEQNLWTDKIEFWILVIVLVVLALTYIIYRIVKKTCLSKSKEYQEQEESQNDANSKVENLAKVQTKGKENVVMVSEGDGDKATNLKSQGNLLSNESVSAIENASQVVVPDSNLWFNELVQIDTAQVKVNAKALKRRRNRTKGEQQEKPSEISIQFSNTQM